MGATFSSNTARLYFAGAQKAVAIAELSQVIAKIENVFMINVQIGIASLCIHAPTRWASITIAKRQLKIYCAIVVPPPPCGPLATRSCVTPNRGWFSSVLHTGACRATSDETYGFSQGG